jgi:uroporphyrinogen-III synthase
LQKFPSFSMEKKGSKSNVKSAAIKILITQPKPESDKSPYFELERKHGLAITFQPFIRIEGLPAKEFRKQKIELGIYSAVIFTSRHAIDHFFRISEELRVNISQETKYFCVSESVALYLQKFILYRKRKVFFGSDGTNKSLFDVINRHKSNETFLFPCSDHVDNEIITWLKANSCDYSLPVMYKTVNNDIRQLVLECGFKVICFFTPSGVKSLLENIPHFNDERIIIGAFGHNTMKAVSDAGLELAIKAPEPQIPSMASALDLFFTAHKKSKK